MGAEVNPKAPDANPDIIPTNKTCKMV
jgi:hypothetical protein